MVDTAPADGRTARQRLRAWLLDGLSDMAKQYPGPHAEAPTSSTAGAGGR